MLTSLVRTNEDIRLVRRPITPIFGVVGRQPRVRQRTYIGPMPCSPSTMSAESFISFTLQKTILAVQCLIWTFVRSFSGLRSSLEPLETSTLGGGLDGG